MRFCFSFSNSPLWLKAEAVPRGCQLISRLVEARNNWENETLRREELHHTFQTVSGIVLRPPSFQVSPWAAFSSSYPAPSWLVPVKGGGARRGGSSHFRKDRVIDGLCFGQEHGLDFQRLLDASTYKEAYRRDMIRWGEEKRQADPGFFCRKIVEGVSQPVWVRGLSLWLAKPVFPALCCGHLSSSLPPGVQVSNISTSLAGVSCLSDPFLLGSHGTL